MAGGAHAAVSTGGNSTMPATKPGCMNVWLTSGIRPIARAASPRTSAERLAIEQLRGHVVEDHAVELALVPAGEALLEKQLPRERSRALLELLRQLPRFGQILLGERLRLLGAVSIRWLELDESLRVEVD